MKSDVKWKFRLVKIMLNSKSEKYKSNELTVKINKNYQKNLSASLASVLQIQIT